MILAAAHMRYHVHLCCCGALVTQKTGAGKHAHILHDVAALQIPNLSLLTKFVHICGCGTCCGAKPHFFGACGAATSKHAQRKVRYNANINLQVQAVLLIPFLQASDKYNPKRAGGSRFVGQLYGPAYMCMSPWGQRRSVACMGVVLGVGSSCSPLWRQCASDGC